MSKPFRNIITGAVCFLATAMTATIGYVLAGWSFLDAVYMVVITVFGVGFGEVRPITSPPLRVFTMMVIVAGSISVVYMVGGFVQLLTEGEIRRILEKRRMDKTIGALDQHVIICGYGRMGQTLALQIQEAKIPFVLIEENQDRVTEAEAHSCLVLYGNAMDEEVLIRAGIHRAKTLASVLPDDAANVFITLTARELNANLTILARGESPSTEKKLRLAGADHVVLPAATCALRMAHLITHPTTLDFLDHNDGSSTINEVLSYIGLHMDELLLPEKSTLANQSIRSLEIQGKGGFIVVGIRRADGTMIRDPDSSLMLNPGDTVIVVGHRGDLPQFARRHHLQREIRYRGAKLQ